MSRTTHLPPNTPEDKVVCPVCQVAIGEHEPNVTCTDCMTVYHEECWAYNRGCAQYGCGQCPPTEKLTDLETPVSYWGREEKVCPHCSKVIQAAAIRCRHCGTVFESARPQEVGEFTEDRRLKDRLPTLRRQGVWLLVFSIISCTAPIAAVVGLIWYATHRKAIARLPPLSATICRIAVGVACVQTLIFIIIALLHSALTS